MAFACDFRDRLVALGSESIHQLASSGRLKMPSPPFAPGSE